MSLFTWIQSVFGNPDPYKDTFEPNSHVTPDEQKARIEDQAREVKARLEALRVQVDVEGRRE